jgi:RNA polymerase sigma factor (sigma-70 family)
MVRRMLGTDVGAEDLVHDAFLRNYAVSVADGTPLSRSLLTITARRLALNELRNRKRRATEAVGDFDALGVLSSDDPAAHAEAQELVEALNAAMVTMPPQCREVFRLRKI